MANTDNKINRFPAERDKLSRLPRPQRRGFLHTVPSTMTVIWLGR
jgi:hypothetical protein